MSKHVALNFSHFGVFVVDLPLMKKFYSEVLGFYITDEGDFPNGQRLVFLSRDPEEHHQVILVSGRPDAEAFNPINQLSFFVADLPALQAFYRLIRSHAVTDIQAVTHGNAWSVYFRDPEDNRIEVYTHTPWYVSQPLREPIDLDEAEAKIVAATEALCRDLPGFQSRNDWLESMRSLMGED